MNFKLANKRLIHFSNDYICLPSFTQTCRQISIWLYLVQTSNSFCLQSKITGWTKHFLSYCTEVPYWSDPLAVYYTLWHCWFGDRKGIRSVKSWVLVCWWWRFDYTSYSSSCHHHLHHPITFGFCLKDCFFPGNITVYAEVRPTFSKENIWGFGDALPVTHPTVSWHWRDLNNAR